MNERTMTMARHASVLLLACLGACGGRYDIGDVGTGGAGGSGATDQNVTGGTTNSVGGTSSAGATSAGGTATSGGSDAAGGSDSAGGSTAAGGSSSAAGGSVAAGGSSSAAGGSVAAGGSSVAGSGGSSTDGVPPPSRTTNVSCATHAGSAGALSYGTLVRPSVLVERISMFLEDGTTVRFAPDVTTPETAAEVVSSNLAADYQSASIPRGVDFFIRNWLKLRTSDDADSNSVVARAASAFTTPGSTLTDLLGADALKDPALNRVHSSIPTRGDMLLTAAFCEAIPSPLLPTGSEPTAPASSPGTTRREALETQELSTASCTGCHSVIDPLGFSLENIDTTGSFRTTDESGNTIDASGTFASPGLTFPVSTEFRFTSMDDLAPQLLDSCEAVRCFVKSYTTTALGQLSLPQQELPDEELDFVVAQFSDNQLTLESLLRAFVQTPTFLQP